MIRWPNSPQLLLTVLLSLLGASFDANAAVTYLPPIGGGGGAQFIEHCNGSHLQSQSQGEYPGVSSRDLAPTSKLFPPQNLAGFEFRAGDDIDAIRPLCVSAYSTGSVTAPELTPWPGLVGRDTNRPASDGFVKLPIVPIGWHGGIGGHLTRVVCPRDRPIVVAMYVAAEGVNTMTVNNIHLYCGLAVPSQQLDENPSAIFDAPKASGSPAVLGIGGSTVSNSAAFQRCPEGQVAVGVHGRSGEWVDAIGLICDAPRISKAVALGRVESTGPTDPTMTICDYAKSARERNSPAAPGLERQCAAQAAANPTVAFAVTHSAGPMPEICDAAKSARARNSPAAPGLERQCNAKLAAKPPAAAPVVAPAPAAAPSPPVQKPHDLRVGRITYTQDGQLVSRPVVGKPVAIACSYLVNEVADPFVFKIQPWQGQFQIGGQVAEILIFQGDIQSGQHEARQIWTPAIAGKTSIACALNPGYEDSEANPSNNRWNEFVDIVDGNDEAPPAQ